MKIVSSVFVVECKTYSIPSFSKSLLNTLKKYPSTNRPLKYQDCSGGRNQTPMFIPAYNMLEHCKQAHDLHNDEDRADELKKHGVSENEKKMVVKLFKINP